MGPLGQRGRPPDLLVPGAQPLRSRRGDSQWGSGRWPGGQGQSAKSSSENAET